MRRFKLLFLFLCLSICLSSQNKKTMTFGFKGGLNNSYVIGENKDYFTGIELYASFFSDIELNHTFNLQNELLFSYTDDFHLIEIPVLLKYKFNKKWGLFLGPKLDFILDNDSTDLDFRYRFKKVGFSLSIGTQYNISKRFFGELRYGYGFTKQIDDLVLELFNSKRRTIRLGFGFNF